MIRLLLSIWLLWGIMPAFGQKISVEVPIPPQDMTPALSLLQALDLAEAELAVKMIDTGGYPLCSAVWENLDDQRRWRFSWAWQALDTMLTQSLGEEGFIDALVDSKGVVTLTGPVVEDRSSGTSSSQTGNETGISGCLTYSQYDSYFSSSQQAEPFPGATITLITEAGVQAAVMTNGEGQFKFPLQKPGIIYIKAAFPGFATVYHRFALGQKPMAPIALHTYVSPIRERLGPIGKFITGRVLTGEQEPLEGVHLRLQDRGKIARATVSEADGRFTLDRLEAKTYTLRCLTPHFSEIVRRVTVAGDSPIDVGTFHLPFVWHTPALSLREALSRADNYFKGKNYISNYRFLSSMCFKIQEGIGTWQLRWSTKVMIDGPPLRLNVAMDGNVYEPGSIRLSPEDLQDLPKKRDINPLF